MNMKIALIADAVCWIGATIVLLVIDQPIIAALVGAFGTVYLFRAMQAYRLIKKIIKEQDNDVYE